jgi:hypothetical protein
MPAAARRRAALPLLAAALLVTACSHPKPVADDSPSQWDTAVEKHVHDAARAARLKTLGHELIALQRSLAGENATFEQQVLALYTDYDATAEQQKRLVDDWVQRRTPALARYRDLLFAMRGEATAEEWKALAR